MAKLRDYGNEETEELLKQLEKRLTQEYSQATKEMKAKFEDYQRRFAIKDEIKRKAVEAGVLDETEYKKWREAQIFNGKRYEAMVNDLAQDLKNVREIAVSTARGYQYDAYAVNHNFATYLIERDAQIDTSYTLFDRQTVERLVREDPELLPPPKPGGKTARKLAENKELRWNRQHISSAVMQGVVQGETVPQMAKRLEAVGEMEHKAAIRNARTMVTGAQNAGRIDAGKRARDMGIGTTNVWMATLDMRTRHEHRVLDGQRRDVDEPFEVDGEKIMYPGDTSASPHLVYNCRCTLIPQVKGFEYDIRGDANMDYSGIEGMTYDEWKEDRREKPNPITLPEEKAEAIKQSYIAEYRKLAGSHGGGDNTPTEPETVQPKEDAAPLFDIAAKREPFASVEEAETELKRICDDNRFGHVGVSLQGLDVDMASRITHTLTGLFDEFDVEKFGGVVAPKGNTKLGKLVESAQAGYSPIRHSFLINRGRFGTAKKAQAGLDADRKALEGLLTHPERYDFSKMSSRLKAVVEGAKTSGRATVPETVEQALTHEFGHALEKAIKRDESYADIVANMKTFAPTISGYATTEEPEYIAESFCSWMSGEDKIDPVLKAAFMRLRRK